MPNAARRNSSFWRYIAGVYLTFSSEEVKWLCQNSVIRSTSGWSVTSISSTHQLRSSRACSCTGRTILSGLPSTPFFSSDSFCASRSSAGPSFTQAGAGVSALAWLVASRRSTAAA